MIINKTGNILEATENVIVNQVSCKGVMANGLCKAFKEKWPKVFTEYKKKYCGVKPSRILMGKTQLVLIDEKKYVANIFAQIDQGKKPESQYTNYWTQQDCIRSLLMRIEGAITQGVLPADTTIAIPYMMGCGDDDYYWKRLYGFIKSISDKYPKINIAIYKPEEVK